LGVRTKSLGGTLPAGARPRREGRTVRSWVWVRSSVLLVIAAGVMAAQVPASAATATATVSPSSVDGAPGTTGHQNVLVSTAVVAAVTPGTGASTLAGDPVVALVHRPGSGSWTGFVCLTIGLGLFYGLGVWVRRRERSGRIRPRDPADLFGSDDPVDPAEPADPVGSDDPADPADEPPRK